MRWLSLAACAVAVAAAGCAKGDTAPTAPATLAPPSITDTFTGTLIQFGSIQHEFTVGQLGEVNITLQATTLQPTVDPTTGETVPPADPKNVPNLTLSIGTSSQTIFGPQCSAIFFNAQPMLINTKAGSSAQIRGSALPGKLCVALSDSAGDAGASLLTAPVDYTIIVAHP